MRNILILKNVYSCKLYVVSYHFIADDLFAAQSYTGWIKPFANIDFVHKICPLELSQFRGFSSGGAQYHVCTTVRQKINMLDALMYAYSHRDFFPVLLSFSFMDSLRCEMLFRQCDDKSSYIYLDLPEMQSKPRRMYSGRSGNEGAWEVNSRSCCDMANHNDSKKIRNQRINVK